MTMTYYQLVAMTYYYYYYNRPITTTYYTTIIITNYIHPVTVSNDYNYIPIVYIIYHYIPSILSNVDHYQSYCYSNSIYIAYIAILHLEPMETKYIIQLEVS